MFLSLPAFPQNFVHDIQEPLVADHPCAFSCNNSYDAAAVDDAGRNKLLQIFLHCSKIEFSDIIGKKKSEEGKELL